MHMRVLGVVALLVGLVAGAVAQGGARVPVLGEGTPWRFTAYYRPPGADPIRKWTSRWTRWGDECTSPLPPADWRQTAFDDLGWAVRPAPVFGVYGYSYKADVTLICLRTRFSLEIPTAVHDLQLSLRFRGGVIAYVNGIEVGRSRLPQGTVAPYAPAEDYSDEEYALPGVRDDGSDLRNPALYNARIRETTFTVPADALRRGQNVLALELHRAGTAEEPFKECSWNTAGLVSATLTAAPDSAIQANLGMGEGVRIWAADPLDRPGQDVNAGDTFGETRLTLAGPLNGVTSGQVVVSSPTTITGVTGAVSDLTAGTATIPASALSVRYARVSSEYVGLLDAPDPDPNAQRPPWRPDRGGATRPEAGPRYLPIWVTAQVPENAKPGTYTGTLTITGLERPATVPIALTVYPWRVGDPADWKTVCTLMQSPESVAGYYKVPMWSDAHFALLEKSFKLMGEAGNDLLGINAVAKTVFGNDPLIVFRKQGETYTPDFTYLERYLSLYNKQAGAPRFLSVQVWHYGMSTRGFGRDGGNQETLAETIPVMVQDGATLANAEIPMFCKPGTEALWTAVLDGIRARVQRLGWTRTTILLGTGGDNWPNPSLVGFFKQVAPWAQWRVITHGSGCTKWGLTDEQRTQPNGMVVGYCDFARRIRFSRVWTEEVPITTNARDCTGPDPFCFASLVMVNTINTGYAGYGWKGLDYWTYTDANGQQRSALNTDVHFGNVVGSTPRAVTAPGPEGAVATIQFEALREATQQSEAIFYIRRALENFEARAKMGPELFTRAQTLVENVGDVYEIGLRTGPHGASDLRRWTAAVYNTAAEIAQATGIR